MTKYNEPTIEVLICECNSLEHMIAFEYWEGNHGWNEVYMTIHLKPRKLRKRIINAIKYIFGHRSKYGEFDEVILKPTDYEKMQKIADYLKSCYEKQKNNECKH